MAACKILLTNFGYGTGLTGSFYDYCRSFYRYFYCPKKIQTKSIHDLKKLIQDEQPDLACVLETEAPQMSDLADDGFRFYDVCNKYGEQSLLRRLPLFRHRSNGFLSKNNLVFKKHFFRHGIKKLVYEIQLDAGTSLFLAHFSLRGKTRQKQFEEISQWVDGEKRVVLCGDFNIFKGFTELRNLVKKTRLNIVNKAMDMTFPAFLPQRPLDLFLHSNSVSVRRLRVMPHQFSDHAPVVIEIEL